MGNCFSDDNDFKITGKYKALKIIGLVILGVIAAALFALLFGLAVKALWNWLMPMIFGLKEIGYWEAVGLVILTKLLFGSFGGCHSHNHKSKKSGTPWWKEIKQEIAKECAKEWTRDKAGDSHHDWEQYHKFWEEEGEGAFDAYLQRQKEKGEDQA